MKRLDKAAMFTFGSCALILFLSIEYFAFTKAQADQPHRESCECRELTRIRLLLEHQFGIVCDQSHCQGASSSSNGGPLE